MFCQNRCEMVKTSFFVVLSLHNFNNVKFSILV